MKRLIGVLLLLAFAAVPMTASAGSLILIFADGGGGPAMTDAVWPGGWPRGWARLVVD